MRTLYPPQPVVPAWGRVNSLSPCLMVMGGSGPCMYSSGGILMYGPSDNSIRETVPTTNPKRGVWGSMHDSGRLR